MTKTPISLQDLRRRIYVKAKAEPTWRFWGLYVHICKKETLRAAYALAKANNGAPGVDGVTFEAIEGQGVEECLEQLRTELSQGTYRPQRNRRKEIPKDGNKVRVLGIPTISDRVVQAALKNILEPIFEADFYPVSYGFRPGRGVHGALEHLRMLLRPRPLKTVDGIVDRLPYQWAIEGDIRGCFDNIDHHALMRRLRRRIGDGKVSRCVLAFIKAGVLSELQLNRTDSRVPQRGILSPCFPTSRSARWRNGTNGTSGLAASQPCGPNQNGSPIAQWGRAPPTGAVDFPSSFPSDTPMIVRHDGAERNQ